MKRLKSILKVLAVLTALGLLTVLLLPDSKEPIGPPGKPPFLTIFLVDGLSTEVFEKELKAGHLPNLAAMINKGIYVPKGVSAFPSMTAYGFYGFITGVDPTLAGLLGLRWVDRSRKSGLFRSYVGRTYARLNEDLRPEVPTLFERFADQHSFSLNSYANRGVWSSYRTGGMFTMTKYKDHWWLAKGIQSIGPLRQRYGPPWEELEKRVLQMAIDDLKNRPKIQWVTLVSPDTYSHVYGVDERYAALVRNIDKLIGEYQRQAKALDGDSPRYYAVVGDHGVETVSKHFGPGEVFERVGLKAHRPSATHLMSAELDDTKEDHAEHDALIAINGNLSAYVYVKSKSGWDKAPSHEELTRYPSPKGPQDLLQTFAAHPAIEFVISKQGPRRFEVRTGQGRALITATASKTPSLRYQVLKGPDPLGYDQHPELQQLIAQGAQPPRVWMEASAQTDYPHAVPRIASLMHQGAGDLVLTSAKGWDLAPDFELFVSEYRGGHGGIRAAQLLTPYLVFGPGMTPKRVEIATSEDLGATLHKLLGAPLHPLATGRDLRR